MRALAVVACVALFVAPQQTVPQQPVFRSGVELVALDVTVVDKDGKPITGLRPAISSSP